MSKGSFDDNGSLVAYTGSWTSITRSGPYANSLHSTTQSGASATVHFTGILGRVFGTVPECSWEGDQVSVTIVLDDSVVGQVTQPCNALTNRDGFMFYDSGTLPGGNQQHKLAIVNQGSFPFQLDMFVWAAGPESGSPTTAVAAPTPTGNPSSTTATSGSSIAASQTSSGSINASMGASSTISMASSISTIGGIALGADVSASSSMQIVTINGIVTSVNVGPSAPTGLGPSDTHGSSSPPSLPIGLIVGCVIGILLFIILLIILLCYCRRRRSKAHATTQQHDAITPFQLAESAISSSTHLALSPDVEQRRLSLLSPAQETKIAQLEDTPSPAPQHNADEKRPLSRHEESLLPSLEPQSSTFWEPLVAPAPRPPRPPSTTSSYPISEVAPAYRPRYQSDMSTFFNLGVRASLIAEAPPSYNS